jgi:ABC-type amino acid transport system permease subunit
MEAIAAILFMPFMICISIGIAYFLITIIFRIMMHLDDWNRSDNC